MNTVKILVGIAGSGKSTYVKDALSKHPSTTFAYSSDDYRERYYGSLAEGNKHNTKVFEKLNRDVMNKLRAFQDITVLYDATNLNRKRRVHLYSEFRKYAKVVIVLFPCTIEQSMTVQNNRAGDKVVPYDAVKQQFTTLQIPRIDVDCDEVEVFFREDVDFTKGCVAQLKASNNLEDVINFFNKYLPEYVSMLKLNYQEHDTPHHLETIDQHINWTIENSSNKDYQNNAILKYVGMFHDLGKGICKDGGKYYGHENVGAYLLYLIAHATKDEELLIAAELCFMHMLAHKGFSDKVIKRNKYDDSLLTLSYTFSGIDGMSRVKSVV